MSKLRFAALLLSCSTIALHAQGDRPMNAETSAPSIEIIAAAESAAPVPLPEPTAAPEPPMRLSIAAATKTDGKPQTAYRSNAPSIFVRWRGENLPVGSVVRLAWIAEDVGDIVDPNFVIDKDETVVPTSTFSARFTISRPSDGWAPGKYRVDLFVDDVLRDTLGITIRD
jgi:hypothetical protein